jgi:hypothetical protein
LATRATTIRALVRKQAILKGTEALSPYRVYVHAVLPVAGSGSTIKPILPQRIIVLKWAGIERLFVMEGNRTLPFCLLLCGQNRLFRWRHQLWPGSVSSLCWGLWRLIGHAVSRSLEPVDNTPAPSLPECLWLASRSK